MKIFLAMLLAMVSLPSVAGVDIIRVRDFGPYGFDTYFPWCEVRDKFVAGDSEQTELTAECTGRRDEFDYNEAPTQARGIYFRRLKLTVPDHYSELEHCILVMKIPEAGGIRWFFECGLPIFKDGFEWTTQKSR